MTPTTLKISVSKYELFDLVAIEQFWNPVKYATDAGYSILKVPAIYREIEQLEREGYQPFETRISQTENMIVCSRYYRVMPTDTTIWLLKTGQTVCVD